MQHTAVSKEEISPAEVANVRHIGPDSRPPCRSNRQVLLSVARLCATNVSTSASSYTVFGVHTGAGDVQDYEGGMQDVVVVGGGISGLVTAQALVSDHADTVSRLATGHLPCRVLAGHDSACPACQTWAH